MEFKEYVEAAEIIESFWDRIFRRNEPNANRVQTMVDKLSAQHNLNPNDLEVADKDSDIRAKKAANLNKTASNYLQNRNNRQNVAQSLQFALSAAGYSPQQIRKYSLNLGDNNPLLDAWSSKYSKFANWIAQELEAKRVNSAKVIAQKALAELQNDKVIEPPMANQPPKQTEYEIPDFNTLVGFIRKLLDGNRDLNPEQVKHLVQRKFPGLTGKYGSLEGARIGKAFKKARMPQLFTPPEAEPTEENPDILPFRKTNKLKFKEI